MEKILRIYEAFENAALKIYSEGKSERESSGEEEEEEEGKKEGRREKKLLVEEEEEGLRKLWIPELERAGRLRRDLARLNCRFLSHDDTAPRLKGFTQHIASSIARKPHLLLAYTWLFYMALFSGGRYIRPRLREAGREFWTTTGGEKEKGGNIDLDEAALSFWNFDGEEDGEDVKAEFKQRFAEIEGWLTGEERDEVVQEAVFIMDSLMGVVEEIAETVGREDLFEKATARHGGVEGDEPSVRWLCIKHILPMGMVELITGTSKAIMMGVESLDGKT